MAKLDDLIQQKQQRDEDWKAKKTAEREELGQLSDDAVMRVTSEPGAYLHYLDTQAINPRYSASNVMLAMAQNPEITYINSLEVWNRLGRSVNRDENGMKIRVSDTYVKDGREYHGYIIASGYPTCGLSELKLENKYHAYYATKMALWCYLLPNWNINNLKVNPNLTGAELQRARAILAAAKDIYVRGTAWNKIYSPRVTAVPDRDTAYAVTVDGQQYKQQVFTIHSDTWVCNYAIRVAFSDPASVPAGARIVDMNNKDITTITTSGTGDGYGGKFKVLYPAAAVAGKTGSVQLSFTTDVYKYAVFYAVCAEQNKYGKLQNYMCDTDPTVTMRLSAYSNFSDGEKPEAPDTGLKIIKLEKGTDTPLSGAIFEVVDPDGATVGTFATGSDGTVTIPLTLAGSYTVYERVAPLDHLLSDMPAQNIRVEYGKVAELTCWNEPYGTLRIEKLSDTGAHLPGAMVQIKHIESGVTYTAETNFAGYAIFDNIKPGAYEIKEITAPSGWLKDGTTYTASVATGETTTFSLVNKELPGLRIIKYDRKNMVAMPNVTFEVFRDSVSLGKFRTDEFGEILLTDAAPGTYRAVEMDTGSDGHILDTTPQEVELSAGDGIKELLFFNDVKPGIRLIKVDSTDPSKVIPNAVFEIKSVAGDYGPKEFTTDQNGVIDLSKLPTGAYVVTEKACEGYIIDQAQRIIQLDANEDAQFVFTNTIKPSLQIIKTSSDGSRLKNVHFRIAKIEDGTHYLDRTTNEQGEILIADLEPGVYSVKETATDSSHILDLREYHMELFAGRTSTLTIENQKRPNLTVYKHDADTGEPIANTVFEVRAADGHSVDQIKTDSEGKAELRNLLPGVYEISEKSVPSPYLLDAPSQLVTLYPNRDHIVYFENHQKPSLTVKKVDSVTGDPLQGAKFQVIYASNNTGSGEINDLGTFYTDENGQFQLTGLRDGWYKVTEQEPPTGYAIKEATQEVYIQSGTSKVLTFENMGADKIEPQEKSIIDRSVGNIYREYIKNFQGQPPTLKDLYDDLMKQVNPEAHRIALALELFTVGSLNVFSHQTNINTKSRILCFDIQDLGENLKSVGLLVMLDAIYNRVIQNRKQGKYTHVYIDEIYLFFANGSGSGHSITNYSSEFLYKCWKRFRKYGATLTGITQNVEECLLSNTARMMFANSEFLLMLNQAATDREQLARLLGASDTQMSYVDNAPAGHGLIKVGGAIVPFANELPKNTELYRLMSTRPGEE